MSPSLIVKTVNRFVFPAFYNRLQNMFHIQVFVLFSALAQGIAAQEQCSDRVNCGGNNYLEADDIAQDWYLTREFKEGFVYNGQDLHTTQDGDYVHEGKFSSEEYNEPDPECFLPLDRGVGTQKSHRWHFNTLSSKCEPFVYRGQGDSGNNYKTELECIYSCIPKFE